MMMRVALKNLHQKLLSPRKINNHPHPATTYFIPLSKYSTEDERNKPTKQPSGSNYSLLSAAHASLAATCFFAPTAVASTLFPAGSSAAAALAHGLQSQTLVQLLGCGFAAGSLSSLALKQAADNHQLNSPIAQRLQLALMAFSSSSIITHALYSPALSFESLLLGAGAMGATFFIPFQSYRVAVGSAPSLVDVAKRYFGAIPNHFRISNLDSAMYSILTPTIAIAGFSYLLFPGSTLASALGYVKDVSSFFLWQNIGCALATILPTMTYSLKVLSDEQKLDSPMAKTLNVGVLGASLGHLMVLWPLMDAHVGGAWLQWIVGAWVYGAVCGGFGLVAPRTGGGAK